jgi:predicted DNA-binding protein
MVKTVSIRLEGPKYKLFRRLAKEENRSLSNFIETATMNYIENQEYVDDFEMAEIRGNDELNRSIKAALKDVKQKRGSVVD